MNRPWELIKRDTPRVSGTIRWLALALMVAILGTTGCSFWSEPPKKLTPVTVQLKWLPDAEFAGFYVADQKGYYAAEGLVVTLVHGGPTIDSKVPVLEEDAQYGVTGAVDIVQARADGKPVRSLAAIYRRTPTVFFALASTGIKRPQDFAGKKVRTVLEQIHILHAMTTKVGVKPKQYTEVNIPSNVGMFASGEVPIWGAYFTSLVVAIERAGHEINIIYPDDYGVHFYGDSIFATDGYLETHQDTTRRFLRATFKGWNYAVENPGQIGALVAKYDPNADVDLENAKMLASIPFVNTGEDNIGWMKPEGWEAIATTLREQGVLTKPLDAKTVYTLQYIREIYGR